MTSITLLEFADTHRPDDLNPDTDIEVYDEGEEEWNELVATSYSLSTLVNALGTEQIEIENIRFSDATAKQYIRHLKEDGFDDQLHQEELMTRERLVAFASAGYTAVDDFLGTTDPIDIAKETGVDRDIVSSIATNYLDGFSPGSSFENTGPLDGFAPKDSFTGWELVTGSPNRIRWVSTGRFNLTISPAPNGSTTVTCNAPKVERNAWYRKGRSVQASPDDSLTPDEALDQAHDWLEEHQLEYKDDLSQLPQIGAATKDYLALEYEITSKEGLRDFADEQPDEFDDIFGSPGSDLQDVLKEC